MPKFLLSFSNWVRRFFNPDKTQISYLRDYHKLNAVAGSNPAVAVSSNYSEPIGISKPTQPEVVASMDWFELTSDTFHKMHMKPFAFNGICIRNDESFCIQLGNILLDFQPQSLKISTGHIVMPHDFEPCEVLIFNQQYNSVIGLCFTLAVPSLQDDKIVSVFASRLKQYTPYQKLVEENARCNERVKQRAQNIKIAESIVASAIGNVCE